MHRAREVVCSRGAHFEDQSAVCWLSSQTNNRDKLVICWGVRPAGASSHRDVVNAIRCLWALFLPVTIQAPALPGVGWRQWEAACPQMYLIVGCFIRKTGSTTEEHWTWHPTEAGGAAARQACLSLPHIAPVGR